MLSTTEDLSLTEFPTGIFAEGVINNLCEAFLPIYAEISKPLFNNSMIASVRRSYHYYDQENGIFEYFVPIHLDGENRQSYLRIAVKCVDGALTPEKLKEESKNMRAAIVSPAGYIDSEMIFIVAPKAQRGGKGELPKGFVHGFYRRYMTYAIVNPIPEICVRRILYLVASHVKKRAQALAEKLNLPRWMAHWFIRSLMRGKRLDVIFTIGQRLGLNVQTLLNNLLNLTVFLIGKFQEIGRKIGQLSILKASVFKASELAQELKGILKEQEIQETIGRLTQLLLTKVQKGEENSKNEKESTFIKKDTIKVHSFKKYKSSDDLKRREQALLEWADSIIKGSQT